VSAPGRRRFLRGLAAAPLGALACAREAPPPAPRVLHVGLDHMISSLDPHEGTGFSSGQEISYSLFEPLVELDPLMSAQPALARSWTTPDDLTLVLDLRRDVRFHGGAPFDAEDVVHTLQRARRPEFETVYYLADLDSVRATGPFQVELRTRRPSPALLNRLGFVTVIPRGAEAEELTRAPRGTGPYALAAWQPGRRLELVRHAPWWRGRPAFDRVVLEMGLGAERAAAGLLAGRYQVAALGFSAASTRVRDSPRHQLLARESLFVSYLGMDLGRSVTPFVPGRPNPFRDPRVRRAIHLGIDRAAVAQRLPGQVHAASQLVPRSVFGYAPEIEPVTTDRTRARALLREAGLAGGFDVTLHTRRRYEQAAPLLAAQLAELGIRARVVFLEHADYFRAIERRELSLWVDNWGCTTGEAGELFENAMHSRDANTGFGAFNESGQADPALDRLIEKSLLSMRRADRLQALQALMREVMERLIWVPLFTSQNFYGFENGYAWEPRLEFSFRLTEITPPPA
jgi:peptide/nickel transport system substrate-binding protein